jgi:hypothetical protein
MVVGWMGILDNHNLMYLLTLTLRDYTYAVNETQKAGNNKTIAY